MARRELAATQVDALLFVTAEGDGLDFSHRRQRVWLPAIKRVGQQEFQFHDLRRTAATTLVQERIDIKTAQVHLGHADLRTTLGLYAQAMSKADRAATERLGERFRPPADPDERVQTTSDHPAPRGMDAGSASRPEGPASENRP
jgi:integrase